MEKTTTVTEDETEGHACEGPFKDGKIWDKAYMWSRRKKRENDVQDPGPFTESKKM
jgi:hypothetical protein